MISGIILAAMVAASPCDSTGCGQVVRAYLGDENNPSLGGTVTLSCPSSGCIASGELEPVKIPSTLTITGSPVRTEPDTIGYWLNRNMDYNWCNSCSPPNEYGSASCTMLACTGREVVDTVWVMRRR